MVLYLVFSIAIPVIVVSCYGIFINGIYAGETANWRVQAIGQDMVDLFIIVPTLITSGILGYYGNKICYQAEGTRGRALVNHAHEIKIHGQYYAAKAHVAEIGGLSAHADQAELITWLKEFKAGPSHIYLVHGEPCAQEALRVKIKDELKVNVSVLKQNQLELLFTIETKKH